METNPPGELPKEEDVQGKVEEPVKVKDNRPGRTGTEKDWIWGGSKFDQIWGGDKFDQPSLEVPMELDESATRQGSEHADEVIPTLMYLWISSSHPFLFVDF